MTNAKKSPLELIKQKGTQAGVALSTLAVTGAAMAEGEASLTSGVVSAIEAQSGNVTTIAVAVLGVLALIAGISYLRRVIR